MSEDVQSMVRLESVGQIGDAARDELVVRDEEDHGVGSVLAPEPTSVRAQVSPRSGAVRIASPGQGRHPETAGRIGETGDARDVDEVDAERIGRHPVGIHEAIMRRSTDRRASVPEGA
jgi:hypothetical protein